MKDMWTHTELVDGDGRYRASIGFHGNDTAVAVALGGTREIAEGLARQKMQAKIADWMRELQSVVRTASR
jgi:hypothetical protein